MRRDRNVPALRDIPKRVRYILPILGLVALIAVLAGIKFGQISTLIHVGKAMQQAGPPPEAVSTTVSRAQTWEAAVSAVGSIAAAKGVALSNDAPGVVSRILFESGASVKQGQIVLELDTNVERAQLASAKAQLDLAGVTASRSRALARTEAISRSQLDSDEAPQDVDHGPGRPAGANRPESRSRAVLGQARNSRREPGTIP